MAETRTTSSTGGQKGVKLARFDLIPVGPLTRLAEHYGRGALKYDDHQWRKGYEWSKSYAALTRHLALFWAGEDYDVCSNDPDGCSMVTADGEPFTPSAPDTCYNHTGSHHMAAVAWHAFALLEFAERHPEHDDRYPSEPPKLTAGPCDILPCDTKVVWGDPAPRSLRDYVDMVRSEAARLAELADLPRLFQVDEVGVATQQPFGLPDFTQDFD